MTQKKITKTKKKLPAKKSTPKDIALRGDVQVDINPQALIAAAIQGKADIGVIKDLLNMRDRIKKEQAEKEFRVAMSEFQVECPIIKKTKQVKTRAGIVAYEYAPLDSIVKQVQPCLRKNNFSYSIQIENKKETIKAICTAKHIGGHQEASEMEVPLGNKTEVMSNSQVVAAAATFAKRYAFCNAFGILTSDEDIDGQSLTPEELQGQKESYENYKKDILECKSIQALTFIGEELRNSSLADEQISNLRKKFSVKMKELIKAEEGKKK